MKATKKQLRDIAAVLHQGIPQWKPSYMFPGHQFAQDLLLIALAGLGPTRHVKLIKACGKTPPRGGENAKISVLLEASRTALSDLFGITKTQIPNDVVQYHLKDPDKVRSIVGDRKGEVPRQSTDEGDEMARRKSSSDSDDNITDTTARRRRAAPPPAGGKKKAASKKKAAVAKKTASKKKAAASKAPASKKAATKKTPAKKAGVRKGAAAKPSGKPKEVDAKSKRGQLLKLLQRARGCSINEACDRLETTDTTVRSMIGSLRASNYAIVSQGGGVFKVD